MRRLAHRCRVYLRAARIAWLELEPMPIMVIETIEGTPYRMPRELSPEEFEAQVGMFVQAGFPLPPFLRDRWRPVN